MCGCGRKCHSPPLHAKVYTYDCVSLDCVCVALFEAGERLMEENGKKSRRQAEQGDHVMVETFGSGSHKHTHTHTDA